MSSESNTIIDGADFVGKTGIGAKESLKATYGDRYEIELVEYGSFVREDFRPCRVRLYLDQDGKVDRTPEIG